MLSLGPESNHFVSIVYFHLMYWLIWGLAVLSVLVDYGLKLLPWPPLLSFLSKKSWRLMSLYPSGPSGHNKCLSEVLVETPLHVQHRQGGPASLTSTPSLLQYAIWFSGEMWRRLGLSLAPRWSCCSPWQHLVLSVWSLTSSWLFSPSPSASESTSLSFKLCRSQKKAIHSSKLKLQYTFQ